MFDHIHAALRPGGILVTNIADHREDFMHVSPRLDDLRKKVREMLYEGK